MKRWIHASDEKISSKKAIQISSRQRGYDAASKYIKKYKKAMQVLAK